ncbi:hypothetical protein J2T55_000137 [Methylohalomonas lacus]|uniref:Uncharacterized protein n=1 Tax=Methylohalomonas lacus TaxID=398773 RepID=A0AAE3HH21_9GAMM|nr:hypothetical protein [Methylohalomonas lacus]MCS3902145.1 hypothetical protein [Methylohalomonas lacus]
MKQRDKTIADLSGNTCILDRSLLALILFCCLGTPTMAKDTASSHVILNAVYDADCEARGGKLVVVHNNHPSQDIEAQLERYFMNVRQGGRSVVRLNAGDAPQPLGCSRVLVDRAEQHWKLVKAVYLN